MNFRLHKITARYITGIGLSFISTLALSFDRSRMQWTVSPTEKNISYFLIFTAISFLSIYVVKQKQRRIIIASAILAGFFSLFEIIGYSFENFNAMTPLIATSKSVIISILLFFGYGYLFYCVLILFFTFLMKMIVGKDDPKPESSRKIFLLYWAFILIGWILYWLAFIPGVMSYDSWYQSLQALGIVALNDHHPILHTLIIRAAYWIGSLFNHENNITGVIVYSGFQMLFMSAVFAFVSWYLKYRKVPKLLVYGLVFWFAALPIHGIYSFTMWKDIPFSGCILLLCISIWEMIQGQERLYSKKMNWILFCSASFGAAFLRHNGLYIILITLILLLIFMRTMRKRLLVLLASVICFLLILEGPIFQLLSVEKGSIKEALSIPLQQIARTVKYHGDEISSEDQEIIKNLLPGDVPLGDAYTPRSSDAVKGRLNTDYLKEHVSDVVVLWLRLGLRYPTTFIASFINNSYGYWYINADYWIVGASIYRGEDTGVYQTPVLPVLRQLLVDTSLIWRVRLPVLGLLYSIGFYFAILIFTTALLILKRRPRFLLAFIPIFILWLTCIASPIFSEFRYAYGMIISAPVLLMLVLTIEKKDRNTASGA